MSIEMLDSVLNINADAVMTTAMAAVLLLIGYFIKSKVSILNKYCIPAPVVGGFLFMFVTFAGHVTNTFKFNFTTSFQDPFMLAFFTTVGLGASFSLLKKGGILLVIYWATARCNFDFPERHRHCGQQGHQPRSPLCSAGQRDFNDRRTRRSGRLRKDLCRNGLLRGH